jgi:hypothetical protein
MSPPNKDDDVTGIVNGATKVATTTLSALSGAPIVIGLLLVNIAFLGFTAYILGEVSSNSESRNKAQLALINDLVHDIRDCRGGTPVTPRRDPTTFTIPLQLEDSK